MTWRLLTADGVTATDGLAADEVIASRAGGGEAPTLRLYTYRPHCALVGRFQDVENELHLAACAEHLVEIGRRPTGGGAILMGPDQLGVALALPGKGHVGRPRALMERFSRGLALALREFGIEAGFRGKNDLEVGGRKIAGLGIYREPSGGLLFHASLLVDLDVELMTRVLRMPFEAVTERELRIVARRTMTMREACDAKVSMEDVRGRVASGFAAAFGVELQRSDPTDEEREATRQLVAEKYGTEEWLFQSTAVSDGAGSFSLPTPRGTLEVRVSRAGAMLKAVHLRGDFFADEDAVADLEWRLRWHSVDPQAIGRTVEEWAARHPGSELPVASLVESIGAATSAAPYGCFVAPGGGEV